MGHGRLRVVSYGHGAHLTTVREGALSTIAASVDDGRDAESKSSN